MGPLCAKAEGLVQLLEDVLHNLADTCCPVPPVPWATSSCARCAWVSRWLVPRIDSAIFGGCPHPQSPCQLHKVPRPPIPHS
jgi:hypothetical protein